MFRLSASDKQDRHTYAVLAEQMAVAPTSFMALHSGEAGSRLFERYGAERPTWERFRAQVSHEYPSIPEWTSRIACDGQALASVPERVVYEGLRKLLGSEVSIDVHPLIGPGCGNRRSDFRLTHRPSGSATHIEVAGLIARDGQPRTPREADYRRYLTAKLEAYAVAGLPGPTLVFVNDVCCPEVLCGILQRVVSELRGAAA